MPQLYHNLIENNKKWAAAKLKADPNYFKQLSRGQQANFLYIGCSDSRMPLDIFTQTEPGELFVHRNIANQVSITDINFLSVLDYALNVVKVQHIIVCGHYDCGGISEAYHGKASGLVANWISPISDLAKAYKDELEQIEDLDQRLNRLVELNVLQQIENLRKTHVIQQAASTGNDKFQIHAWVLDLGTGIIKDLTINP